MYRSVTLVLFTKKSFMVGFLKISLEVCYKKCDNVTGGDDKVSQSVFYSSVCFPPLDSIYSPTLMATPSSLITTYPPLKIITYYLMFEKPRLKSIFHF